MPVKFSPRFSIGISFLLFIVFIIQALGFIRAGIRQIPPHGTDFLPYWVSVQHIKKHASMSLYSDEAEDAVNVFATDDSSGLDDDIRYWDKNRDRIIQNQSPFLYSVIAAVGSDDFKYDFLIFRIISIGCFFGAVTLLCVKLRYTINGALAVLVYLLSASTPIASDIGNANINLIQLGLLSVAITAGIAPLSSRYASIRYFIAGALFALCFMLKPTTFFVPFFLFAYKGFRKEWSSLAYGLSGVVAGSAFSVVMSSLVIGTFSCWWQWIHKNSAMSIDPVVDSNFSLPAILLYLTGNSFSIPVLATGLLLVVYRAAKFMSAECKAEISASIEYRLAAAGGLVWLICMPLAWIHYYVLAIPMLLWIMSPDCQENRTRGCRALSWLAVLAVSLGPLAFLAEWLLSLELHGENHSHTAILVIGCSAWLASVTLFFIGTSVLSTTPEQQVSNH